jgi:hypothetical protein
MADRGTGPGTPKNISVGDVNQFLFNDNIYIYNVQASVNNKNYMHDKQENKINDRPRRAGGQVVIYIMIGKHDLRQ